MHSRYPRSIIVTLCVALALAITATLATGHRGDTARGYGVRAGTGQTAPAPQPPRHNLRL